MKHSTIELSNMLDSSIVGSRKIIIFSARCVICYFWVHRERKKVGLIIQLPPPGGGHMVHVLIAHTGRDHNSLSFRRPRNYVVTI